MLDEKIQNNTNSILSCLVLTNDCINSEHG